MKYKCSFGLDKIVCYQIWAYKSQTGASTNVDKIFVSPGIKALQHDPPAHLSDKRSNKKWTSPTIHQVERNILMTQNSYLNELNFIFGLSFTLNIIGTLPLSCPVDLRNVGWAHGPNCLVKEQNSFQ